MFYPLRKHLFYFLTVVSFAFLMRAAFLISVGSDDRFALTPDSIGYIAPAVNLYKNRVFSSAPEFPFISETIRTPGYPIFLVPFVTKGVPHIRAIAWTQAFLGALTAGLVYWMALLLLKNNFSAMAAGLGIAFDWVIVLHTIFVMTEPVFLFLFVLGLLFLSAAYVDSPGKKINLLAMLSGLFFGAATLVRPVGIYYFVFPSVLLLVFGLKEMNKPKIKMAALVAFFSIIIPFGWMVRNRATANTWSLSTLQGVTRAAILEERLSGRNYEEACNYLLSQFHSENPQGFSSLSEESAAQSRWAIKFILRHPLDYSMVLMKETVKFFGGNSMKAAAWLVLKDPEHDPFTIIVHPKESNSNQALELARKHPSLGIGLAVYLLFIASTYLLAGFGFVKGWKKFGPEPIIFISSSFLYIFLVSIGMGAHSRYRIPAMPALFLLAGWGLNCITEKFRRKNEPVEINKPIKI